ncbi:Uncharacterised protein [uncultured archaeon]|nr:Uncharacterised protein [uncultured archaeon]
MVLAVGLLGLLTIQNTIADGSTATIWTDKADYAPEEIVCIYGTGFLPNTPITVQVT